MRKESNCTASGKADALPLHFYIAERAALADCPNILPCNQALATERAGYLIRQWVASSLYDKIRRVLQRITFFGNILMAKNRAYSTRPFLSMIEKKWIAFQLLTALRDMHVRKVACQALMPSTSALSNDGCSRSRMAISSQRMFW